MTRYNLLIGLILTSFGLAYADQNHRISQAIKEKCKNAPVEEWCQLSQFKSRPTHEDLVMIFKERCEKRKLKESCKALKEIRKNEIIFRHNPYY